MWNRAISRSVRRFEWPYDHAEIVADGVVHVLGIGLGLAAIAMLIALAARVAEPLELTSVLVYGGGLLTVLMVSALYNLWPISRAKWLLRRFDHSAIYLLIAGTYTPFISQMKTGFASMGLLVGIWATAPFLHNGSVPTLYDLLLPAARRPVSFPTGQREYDPIKLGIQTDRAKYSLPPGLPGFLMDTRLRGNWNTGHEWSFYPTLTDDQRYAIIEFLKTYTTEPPNPGTPPKMTEAK